MKKKIVFLIPAHLGSVRLKRKILLPIKSLPLIEHVRRRIILNYNKDLVYVATPNKEIKKVVLSNGGNVIFTSNKHTNGTSRVSEAIKKIDCTHIILVQGDEPLILPHHLKKFYNTMLKDNKNHIWNATSSIDENNYNTKSMVKCEVNSKGIVKNLFRKIKQKQIIGNKNFRIRKILGLIGFERNVLENFNKMKISKDEKKLSIEQIRYLYNNLSIKSINFRKSLPSVNEKQDIQIVINELNRNYIQKKIYKVISNEKF